MRLTGEIDIKIDACTRGDIQEEISAPFGSG